MSTQRVVSSESKGLHSSAQYATNSRQCFAGDSERLITASADSSVKLWDVASGKDLFTFKSQEPCRAVAFSVGDRMAAYSTDQFMGQPSAIHLVNIADDLSHQSSAVIKSLSGPKGRITRVAWTDLNRTLVTAGEDGFVRRWDVEVGTCIWRFRSICS